MTAGESVAKLSGITHRYGSVTAVADISLELPAGQMVGLLGPDGVGKSTLLGLISGSRKLQTGTLELLGGDMRTAQYRALAGPRIAYMPQGLGKNLYPELSIAENLDFFGKLFSQSRAERTARIAHLTGATGLAPFLNRPAGKLSGGMKQKLGLCCALIHDPDFLILDEPTTGVDPLSRRQFWELIDAIRSERPGMSVLVSTAYMDEAEAFDWLVAMDAGSILDVGTPDALKKRTGAADLETAFVRLLPEGKRGDATQTAPPPLEEKDTTPVIVARNLTRKFGDFVAVNNVSFKIRTGEIFGFLGSNGCGKTTTMKMLTGLLPPSEGSAEIFGNPVNANDLNVRKRVGFMSQSFSLYGELTVMENLRLHARLFDMAPAKYAPRLTHLIDAFGLQDHVDAPAGELPLGIRQRLSLAVAIVHEPEILILDEPTSGVDPVARDRFWELLIDLSRNQNVTIFISTHFMSEAMRCDRISLMHAGRVMVYDTPENLIETKQVETLEDAFISYMEDAINEIAPISKDIAETPAAIDKEFGAVKAVTHKRSRFSLSRALAYSYRETMEVLRDPVRLLFAFAGSLVLLLIMAFGMNQDVDELTYAVLDHDQSPESRQYLNNFSGSLYFIEEPQLVNLHDLETELRNNTISVALEIPPGFGRDLRRGDAVEVLARIDGANPSRADTLESYVNGAHADFVPRWALENGGDAQADAAVTIEPRFAYNPTSDSLMTMGPAIPAMLLMMFPAILMAVSIAREKENGTITNFYVTPTRRAEYLFGKQVPYLGIALINFILLNLLVVFVLQVPLKGSVVALSLGAILYAFAATGYGLVISTLTNTQVAAVFAGALLSMLPTMSFSGLMQPVSTLEGGAQIMGTLWPTTYFLHLSVGTYTKGLSITDVRSDLIALCLFYPVFFGIALATLKKQER